MSETTVDYEKQNIPDDVLADIEMLHQDTSFMSDLIEGLCNSNDQFLKSCIAEINEDFNLYDYFDTKLDNFDCGARIRETSYGETCSENVNAPKLHIEPLKESLWLTSKISTSEAPPQLLQQHQANLEFQMSTQRLSSNTNYLKMQLQEYGEIGHYEVDGMNEIERDMVGNSHDVETDIGSTNTEEVSIDLGRQYERSDRSVTKLTFKNHKRTDKEENPQACRICNKSFKRKAYLKRHFQIHTGVKSHICEVCDKSFTYKHDLKRHSVRHSDISARAKNYTCNVCNESFLYKQALESHSYIHTGGGDRPYKCSQCEKAFRFKQNAVAHLRVHSGDRPYICKLCDKSFKYKFNLSQHSLGHTSMRHACQVCNKLFKIKSSLRQHLKNHIDVSN